MLLPSLFLSDSEKGDSVFNRRVQEKGVFEVSFRARKGFRKVDRSRGGHSGKGNGTHEGLDMGKSRRMWGVTGRPFGGGVVEVLV